MEIRPRGIGGGALVRGWEAGSSAASAFFPGAPGDAAAFLEQAGRVDARFGRSERERAAGLLECPDPGAAARLQSFVEQGGLMVTTGQQPGLFGGPLYGLYKAMTAVALARDLEERLGRPVLPVFWVASEDHDWEEVRAARVIDAGNELREVALPPRAERDQPPLFRVPVGHELAEAAESFLGHHPDSDFSPRWKGALRSAYRSGSTLPAAYQALFAELLAGEGVFVVQSHHPELKRASLPLLLRELEASEAREEAVRDRSNALAAAGFELQVPWLEEGTSLFLEGPTGRERLFRDPKGFRLRRSGTLVTLDEVRRRVEGDPSLLSPNVLLRPVVESTVFPTLAYVAGPGEAAYFPQTEPVFRGHGIPMPLVHPRFAAEVLERKVGKVLEKFGVESSELSVPFHELASRLTREDLPPAVRAALGDLKGAVAKGSGALARAVQELDPTLKGPVEHLRGQTLAGLEEVERKVVQSLKRENEIALSQLEKAQLHLYPVGKPQERVLNPLYYLVRYGDSFLERLRDLVRGSGLR